MPHSNFHQTVLLSVHFSIVAITIGAHGCAKADAVSVAKQFGHATVVQGKIVDLEISQTNADKVIPILPELADLRGLDVSGVKLTRDQLRTIGSLEQLRALKLS